jgi:glycosyltransferase involved in cell wall biosynthesis
LFFPLLEQELFIPPLLVDANPPIAPKSTLKRVGFFGQQSTRKGSKLISELTQHLLKVGLEVVVQNSLGNFDGVQSQQLTILGYVDNFSEEISKCDLVILPYDPYVYKNMASGVAWEAIARAVPVIAPANTVPGGFVTSENAGITFKEFTAESIIDAVTQASSEFKTIADGAFRASKNWSTNNGTDKFVEAILLPRN